MEAILGYIELPIHLYNIFIGWYNPIATFQIIPRSQKPKVYQTRKVDFSLKFQLYSELYCRLHVALSVNVSVDWFDFSRKSNFPIAES